MCKHALCQNLSKLYAFLVKAVHIPQEALEHDLVLKVCQKCSERLWVYLLTDDDAGWTSALEILVAVLIGFAACECHDLSCDICAELLLACAVLDLKYFLERVIPVAAECDVNMAIHEDDPCWSIFGLPRIITCEKNIDRFLGLVDDPHNGITLCTGSLGCSNKNDVVKMAAKYAAMGRIHFAHLRNVAVLENGFEERAHLSSCGSLDMYAIVKALHDNGFTGYVRPDHGRMIWGETGRPGYGLYDRALGATYINGLFEAVEKASKEK